MISASHNPALLIMQILSSLVGDGFKLDDEKERRTALLDAAEDLLFLAQVLKAWNLGRLSRLVGAEGHLVLNWNPLME